MGSSHVIQLSSFSQEEVEENILKAIDVKGPVTASMLAHHFGVSLSLAALQLKELEDQEESPVCRDDTVEGLYFHRNIFV